MNEQLERIEKMLSALLKSSNHIWWIGGYVYGQKSNGEPFIVLYPAGERLKDKVCRVYDHDFRKLPAFIDTSNVTADTAEYGKETPDKLEAQKKGIYHECPLFQIATYDGRDTRMGPERRFGDVLRISNQPAPAAAAPAGKTRQQRQPRQSKPRQAPAAPPPPPAAADDDGPPLPDYRQMAIEAKTAAAFDYGAYMTLKNGLYTEQSRITAIRDLIDASWKPGAANAAMLEALTTYRDKREATMKRGDTATEAHNFALIEATNKYNRLLK